MSIRQEDKGILDRTAALYRKKKYRGRPSSHKCGVETRITQGYLGGEMRYCKISREMSSFFGGSLNSAYLRLESRNLTRMRCLPDSCRLHTVH
jgi:hypothetical protein